MVLNLIIIIPYIYINILASYFRNHKIYYDEELDKYIYHYENEYTNVLSHQEIKKYMKQEQIIITKEDIDEYNQYNQSGRYVTYESFKYAFEFKKKIKSEIIIKCKIKFPEFITDF